MKILYKLLIILFFISPLSADAKDYILPSANEDGSKWTLALFDSQANSSLDLISMTCSLIDMDWIYIPQNLEKDWEDMSSTEKKAALQKEIQKYAGKKQSAADVWQWLSEKTQSDYLQFGEYIHEQKAGLIKKNIFEFVNSLKKKDNENKEFLSRLKKQALRKKDSVDCVLTTGPTSAQAFDEENIRKKLAALEHPPVIFSLTGFQSSSKNKNTSFHIWASPFDPAWQINFFHNLKPFKTLGVLYRNPVAVSPDLANIAARKKFEILSCALSPKSFISSKSLSRLLAQADAIYITREINGARLEQLLQEAAKSKLWTFSQAGESQVECGVLMGISSGRFYAEKLANTLNSLKKSPDKTQFAAPANMRLLINVNTAKQIGYDPPIAVLGVANEIYDETICSKEEL